MFFMVFHQTLRSHRQKLLILTRIGCFRKVIPGWSHQWLKNHAQSLMLHRKDALLFFEIIKFHGHMGQKINDSNPIWVRLLGLSQLSNPLDLPCFRWSQWVLLGDHDDVIKWKHFLCYWPFVGGIYQWLVNSPAQKPVTRSFDVFSDLRLNKGLSKQ